MLGRIIYILAYRWIFAEDVQTFAEERHDDLLLSSAIYPQRPPTLGSEVSQGFFGWWRQCVQCVVTKTEVM